MTRCLHCADAVSADTLIYRDSVYLECHMNLMVINGKMITLNEGQKRLMMCLIKRIHSKRDIINAVWGESSSRIRDNNYHQLIFQLRASFKQHELPPELILTIPNYGVKLNDRLIDFLNVESKKNSNVVDSVEPYRQESAFGSMEHTAIFERLIFPYYR